MRSPPRPLWMGAAAVLVAAVSACAPCAEEPGSLCRIAGTGERGFNGDGRAARETDFYQVTAARRGPDGTLYVMDFNNHRLRRITANDTVETVVGTGDHLFAVPGSPPAQSPLENPVDFAFSPDGVLHLVMFHDPRVLRIGDTVEIAAGTVRSGDTGDDGPALQAQFTQLAGIAFAKDGRMFLADNLTHRVRVVGTDGIVRAVAGTGVPGYSGDGGPATSAQLTGPRALAVDAEGTLYVADPGNHVVRRIHADGTIDTFAGTGRRGYGGDGGPANAAEFSQPSGVAVGADGAVYIADTGNERIRRVGADGTVHTVAGNGERGLDRDDCPALEAQLNGPYGIDVDAEGRLLISELRSGTVSVVFPEN